VLARFFVRGFIAAGGIRIVGSSGGASERLPLSTAFSMASAVNFRCSMIDGGDEGNNNSFSFGSTALALSCDELPPSPCMHGVRVSKVRDCNGDAEGGAEGISALEESE